jgi:hypothetical protein
VAVIRSDGRVSDGAGDHAAFACSYLSFEAVVEAMEELRALGASEGYYYRTASGKETYNLAQGLEGGSPKSRADNVPTGIALPYKVTTRDEPTQTPGRNVRVFKVRKGPEGAPVCPTHATAATLNAVATALSAGTRDSSGVLVPKLSEGWLPQRFGDLWQVLVRDPQELGSEAQKEELGQGAARAIQAFNLGVQIDPLKLLRGDPIQLGTSSSAPHHGHALFCFATRRFRGDEVRFLALGSQIDTCGVGVRISDLARSGILAKGAPGGGEVLLKVKLVDTEGEPLCDHRYQLQVGGKVFAGRSDATGRVALSVPPAEKGTLSFWLDEDEDECITWELSLPSPGEAGAAEEGGLWRSGSEWVVSKSSRPFQYFVYRPGPLQSGRSVTHAYRFGRWQVLRKGEGDKVEAFAPWRGEAYAARLFHEFPRYPLRLAGSNDPDYITPEGHAATLDVTTERYYRNTERLSGGYFPIGRSRVWHNGVHFEPDEPEGLAYAPLDGRVVAARLADPELCDEAGEPRFPFGSGNFVLLKHALEVGGQTHEFFSLLMHLGDPQLRLIGEEALLSDRAAQLPWLRELALAPDGDEAKDEAASLEWQKLYLKVWKAPSGGDHALGDAPLEAGDLLEVGPLDLSEDQWRTAHGLAAGSVKRVSDGAEGTIDPAAINADGGLIAPYDAFPTQFTEVKEKLLAGEVVDLWEHELIVRCGEPIGHLGTWHGEARLQFEIFSEALIPVEVLDLAADPQGEPSYVAKAKVDYDSGDDAECFFDRAKFLEEAFEAIEATTNETLGYDGEEKAIRLRDRVVGETTSVEDRSLIREQELQRFFNQPRNSLAPVFRNLVVRHLSEWGTKVGWESLRKAAEHLGEPLGDRLEALGKQSAGYAWWGEGLGQEAGLPQDQVAHFYHPVTFLAWLERARQAEVPKGGEDALHTSALELNTDVEGPAGGGEAEEREGKLVRLRICDDQGVPLEGARYELKVGEETFSGQAGPGGLVEHEVAEDASEGRFEFWPEGEQESRVCPVRIK